LIFFFHLPSLLDLLHPTLRTAGALPPMSQLRSLQLVPLPPPPAGDRLQAYAIAPAPTAGRLQPQAQSCRWLPLGDAPAPVVGRLQLSAPVTSSTSSSQCRPSPPPAPPQTGSISPRPCGRVPATDLCVASPPAMMVASSAPPSRARCRPSRHTLLQTPPSLLFAPTTSSAGHALQDPPT
jgi:hypothetical protein